MIVELRDHFGTNMATGRQEKIPQYRVWVDGRAVGYMGWRPTSKLCLVERFGPLELQQIEAEVEQLLKREVASSQAPDVPPEMLQTEPELSEGLYDDVD